MKDFAIFILILICISQSDDKSRLQREVWSLKNKIEQLQKTDTLNLKK